MLTSLHLTDPWNVAVPLAPASFEPLEQRHLPFAVRTDLGAIASFAVPTQTPMGPLLLADLQMCPEVHIGRRLGSGRAGFFEGKYLKGVGRTTLAGNWNQARDAYHATGHMFASATVREWVATRYLAAKGGLDLIVPCEGVLFARLDKAMRAGIGRFEATLTSPLAPIDRALQGITIKSADFARFSNVAWALSCIAPYAPRLADLGYRMEAYARTLEDTPLAANQCRPSSIAAAMAEAVTRASTSILRYPSFGVYWGSYHNNFTLDGRFLDIELPTFCGAPFMGCHVGRDTAEVSRPPRDSEVVFIGTELFDYLHHIKAMVEFMVGRLRYLCGYCADGLSRDFTASLADAIERAFGPEHIVGSPQMQVAWVRERLIAAGGRPRAVDALCRNHWHTAQAAGTDDELRGLGLELRAGTVARAEPTRHSGLYRATGITEHHIEDPQADAEAEFINRALVHADRLEDVDDVLAYLTKLGQDIARFVTPVASNAAPTKQHVGS